MQLGAGAMSYDVNVAGFSRKATNLAVNAGLVPTSRREQHLASPVREGLHRKVRYPEAAGIDYEAKTSHNVALTAA